MNILKRELRANLKSLMIWSASMAALIYMGMIKYSAFEKTGAAVNDFFEQLPPAMMKVMGIEPGYDLTSVAVFYSIFFLYFLLLAAVHSTMLGTLIIIKEERDKTADFLYVKPVKREYVLFYKMIAAFINITIVNIVTLIFSLISTAPYAKDTPMLKSIVYLMIGLYLVQVLFLGIGLLLGGIFKHSKLGTSIGTGIILATFMLKVIIDLKKDLDFLDFLTPFRYFQPGDLMFEYHIAPIFAGVALGLSGIFIAGMFYFFRKRDLG